MHMWRWRSWSWVCGLCMRRQRSLFHCGCRTILHMSRTKLRKRRWGMSWWVPDESITASHLHVFFTVPPTCGDGMAFSACSTECLPSCNDPKAENCAGSHCVPQCTCKEGLVYDKDTDSCKTADIVCGCPIPGTDKIAPVWLCLFHKQMRYISFNSLEKKSFSMTAKRLANAWLMGQNSNAGTEMSLARPTKFAKRLTVVASSALASTPMACSMEAASVSLSLIRN